MNKIFKWWFLLLAIPFFLPAIVYTAHFWGKLSNDQRDWAAFGTLWSGGLAGIALVINAILVLKNIELTRNHQHFIRNSETYNNLLRDIEDVYEESQNHLRRNTTLVDLVRKSVQLQKYANGLLDIRTENKLLKLGSNLSKLISISQSKENGEKYREILNSYIDDLWKFKQEIIKTMK